MLELMITHRYLTEHYYGIPILLWPLLFWRLWCVDRWCAETDRTAFVIVDRYARVWVPYFEGMGVNYTTHGLYQRFYAPRDVEKLCPQILERALAQSSADASERWGLGTTLTSLLRGAFLPWTPATQSSWAQRYAGVGRYEVHLDPG